MKARAGLTTQTGRKADTLIWLFSRDVSHYGIFFIFLFFHSLLALPVAHPLPPSPTPKSSNYCHRKAIGKTSERKARKQPERARHTRNRKQIKKESEKDRKALVLTGRELENRNRHLQKKEKQEKAGVSIFKTRKKKKTSARCTAWSATLSLTTPLTRDKNPAESNSNHANNSTGHSGISPTSHPPPPPQNKRPPLDLLRGVLIVHRKKAITSPLFSALPTISPLLD